MGAMRSAFSGLLSTAKPQDANARPEDPAGLSPVGRCRG